MNGKQDMGPRHVGWTADGIVSQMAWKSACVLGVLFLFSVFLPSITMEAVGEEQMPVMDLQVSELYSGFTLSWVSPEVTTGRVLWGWTPTGLDRMANDTRGGDYEGCTHYVRIQVSFNDMMEGKTVYYQIVYDNNTLYPTDGPLSQPIPVVEELTTPYTLYGYVNSTLGGVSGAIVTFYVERGDEKTTMGSTITGLTGDDGLYFMDTANLLWADNTTYTPQAGDTLYIRVNGGPYGEVERTETITGQQPQAIPDLILQTPFTLSAITISPEAGDESTEFTFSVTYTAEDGISPESIILVLDDEEYTMTPSGSVDPVNGTIYTYATTLSEGNHTYYVKLSRQGMTFSTKDTVGGEGVISVAPQTSPPPSGKNPLLLYGGIGAIVVAAVVIGIVLYKRKRM